MIFARVRTYVYVHTSLNVWIEHIKNSRKKNTGVETVQTRNYVCLRFHYLFMNGIGIKLRKFYVFFGIKIVNWLHITMELRNIFLQGEVFVPFFIIYLQDMILEMRHISMLTQIYNKCSSVS